MNTGQWAAITCAVLAAFAAAVSSAADAPATKVTALAADRFVAGGSVRQTEPVRGDLIAVGGDLDLEATVQGDVVTAGGSVHVRERVGQGVYAAGGRVLIDAPVARNARVAGGQVEIGSKAAIEGNLSIAGGHVVIRGPVKGYVQAAGGEVLIDAAVEGDVVAACGKLELGPNARIGGALRYRAGEELKRDPAAQVVGSVERLPSGRGIARSGFGRTWTRGWLWTAGLVVLAVILVGALPAAGLRVGGELRAHPWLSLLVGFVALVCVPAAAVLVMLTVIGIPLGLLVILLYLALLLVGYVATAVTIGDLALTRAKPAAASRVALRMAAAALAVLALALLARIPFVGGFFVLVAIVIGVGALFMAAASIRKPATA